MGFYNVFDVTNVVPRCRCVDCHQVELDLSVERTTIQICLCGMQQRTGFMGMYRLLRGCEAVFFSCLHLYEM